MRRSADDDLRAGPREPHSGERSDMMDAVDQLSRRVSGAIMLGAIFIAFGLYAGGGSGGTEAPEYQAFAADGEVFRLNTDSGTIIACNAQRCTRILEKGQDLAEDQGGTLFKTPAGPQAPAVQPAPAAQQVLPAPAATPAPAAAPAQTK